MYNIYMLYYKQGGQFGGIIGLFALESSAATVEKEIAKQGLNIDLKRCVFRLDCAYSFVESENFEFSSIPDPLIQYLSVQMDNSRRTLEETVKEFKEGAITKIITEIKTCLAENQGNGLQDVITDYIEGLEDGQEQLIG